MHVPVKSNDDEEKEEDESLLDTDTGLIDLQADIHFLLISASRADQHCGSGLNQK